MWFKNMTKIKICGITNLEDALLSAKFGALALGFNFYEKSPRYIAPEKAREIIKQLPEEILKVGVFVNESLEKIVEIAETVKLDALQLHGEETPECLRELKQKTNLEIIKAFRVSPEFKPEDVLQYEMDAILLDAYSPKEHGGTGETFDWEIAKKVQEIFPKMYLAGGLSELNIGNAIENVIPYAVDACSLLELSKGKKDLQKTQSFIENAELRSRHYEKPEIADLSDDEFQEMIERLTSSDYHKYVSKLIPLIKGKVVESSVSGNSGFLLKFTDNFWAICFLENEQLLWKFGENDFPKDFLELINNEKFGDGRKEFSEDLPYSDEKCFMEREIAKTFGKEIWTLAIGERNFSFCFPKGMELSAMLFPDDTGKLTLRVFWEQW
ncbi:hypothetical protein BH20ACI4_BH20ACI4_23440 [soil metagenome]